MRSRRHCLILAIDMLYHLASNGTGPTVVLVHGNSFDHAVWSQQMNDPALAHLRLIALDLPGHGASRRNSAGTAYSGEGLTTALTTFISDLPAPLLVGHSLGGHLCVRALARSPHVRGALIFGAPPLSSAADVPRAYLPNPDLAKAFQADLTEAEATVLATAFTWPDCPHLPGLVRAILSTDPRVRSDLGAEIATGHIPDEQAIIRSSGRPVCVAHGAEDAFLSGNYFEALAPGLFWEDRTQTIIGAGHFPQLQQPHTFNALLSRFADR